MAEGGLGGSTANGSSLRIPRPHLSAVLLGAGSPVFSPPGTWAVEADPCAGWEGVVCNEFGAVRELSLAESGLRGRLPLSWSELSALEVLDLEKNYLRGRLPVEWSVLSSLKELDLRFNKLTATLPQQWSALQKIEALLLGGNKLSGSLPQDWRHFSVIRALALGHQPLTGTLPSEWSTLTTLEFLDLSHAKLRGTLPLEWSTLRSLNFMAVYSTRATGTLPAQWSTLTALEYLDLGSDLAEFDAPHAFSGPLPPQWSTMNRLNVLILAWNRGLTGTLPAQWSTFSRMGELDLSLNQFVGHLPVSWSVFRDLYYMNVAVNSLTGCIPHQWSSLTGAENLYLHSNSISCSLPVQWSTLSKNLVELSVDQNALTGKLPNEWSTLTSIRQLSITKNHLTGTLPPSWSNLKSVVRLSLIQNSLEGTLPPSWSILDSATHILLDFNLLTGPVSRAFGEFSNSGAVGVREEPDDYEFWWYGDKFPEEWADWYGGYYYNWYLDYDAPEEAGDEGGGESSESAHIQQLGVGFNSMAGDMPDPTNITVSADFNCGLEGAEEQRYCPAPNLWRSLFIALLMVPLLAVVALATVRGPARFMCDFSFAVNRLEWRRAANKMVISAVMLGLAWNLFVLTEMYQVWVHTLASWVPSVAPVAFVVLSVLGSSWQPGAVLMLAVWWFSCALRAHFGRPDASAWTVMASQDVLAGNLRVIRSDQLMLLTLFSVITPLCGLITYFVLPRAITIWVYGTPEEAWYPLVWVQMRMVVPAFPVALCCASFVMCTYHAVAAASLPTQVWAASCARVALRHTSTRLTDNVRASLVQPLFWLWPSFLITVVLVTLFVGCSIGAVMRYASHVAQLRNAINYKDVGTVVEAGPGPWPITLMSICVLTQIAVLAAWTAGAWRHRHPAVADASSSTANQGTPLDSRSGRRRRPVVEWLGRCQLVRLILHAVCGVDDFPDTAIGRGRENLASEVGFWYWFQATAMGRSRLVRNLLLAVLGLLMLPDAGKQRWGLPLVLATWVLMCLLLLAACLARDRPGCFQELHGKEGFGLVLLARDLAEALEIDLAREAAEVCPATSPPTLAITTSVIAREPSQQQQCCKDSPGGCKQCQLLIRRFPATLFRMEETLAISYRWQPVSRAVIHPPDFCPDGRTSIVGIRNGVVGVNMSRWQRQQLLALLKSTGYRYVWLDALSIPAALQPPPGTPLSHISETLLTRMMAVYAAAAGTLALRSLESPPFRYHKRAWTMQEFCGARELEVFDQQQVVECGMEEELAAVGGLMAADVCEVAAFQTRRALVRQRMVQVIPLWVRSLTGKALSGDWILQGVSHYAQAKKEVTCECPQDLVRALLPMFLTTAVQDMGELRELVRSAYEACLAGRHSDELQRFEMQRQALDEACLLLEMPIPNGATELNASKLDSVATEGDGPDESQREGVADAAQAEVLMDDATKGIVTQVWV